MGKKYASSRLDDLLVESGVYGAGAVSALMKGKAYNHGVHAHKLLMEAFFGLLWQAFLNWCQSSGQDVVSRQRDELSQKIKECIAAVVKTKGVSTSIRQLSEDFTKVTEAFERYKATRRTVSEMFAFREEYLAMVNILVQFIKAERTADWDLHLTTVVAMLPHFFEMDRQNYARWLPIYLADMNSLAAAHPREYDVCVSHFTGIGCNELWFCTGVSDRQRYIPVHSIQEKLGERLCQSLPAFHALKGCDSTSSLSCRGKKKPWTTLQGAPPTRQLLACLDSSQTWMRSLLKAPRLSFVIYTPRHEDKQVPWTRR